MGPEQGSYGTMRGWDDMRVAYAATALCSGRLDRQDSMKGHGRRADINSQPLLGPQRRPRRGLGEAGRINLQRSFDSQSS